MVFLRSEEHLERWFDAQGQTPGASLTAPELSALARECWWSRLDPGWQPRKPEESQAILDGLGLTGEFWALQ